VADAARQAMRLEHPSITRVYDQGVSEETGDLYIASEYVRGITLAERVRRVAPFTLSVAVDLSVAIVEGLAYAHREGLVHGDLRAADVLLSPEGQVKVANFAYARAAQGGGPASEDDDLAAFGVLLYQMLTGTLPMLGGANAPSPRVSNPGVPIALDGIVQKCLHPNPALRYGAAATVLLDLQAVREALRSGRSLAWSPLAEKRAPRPSAGEATVVTTLPSEVPMTHPADPGEGERPRPAAPLAAAAVEQERERSHVRERSSPFGKLVAVVFVLAVLGVIGLSWYVSKFLAIPNDVLVPNLVGKTFDDAKRLSQQQHFTLVEAGSDYSTRWPENQIYQQDPLPGRTIKADKEVSVFRSLGPRLLTVPNLVGMTRDRALRDLQDTGLPPGAISEEYSETVPRGIVLTQSPDKGAMTARSSAVNLSISKGRQPPDSPEGVEADAAAPDSVSVHWNAAARADSYTVYRIVNGNSVTVAQALKDTRFMDKGLTPDTSYSYTVTAFNAAGDSGPGEPAIVTTPPKVIAPPTLPGDINVVNPPASGTDTTDSTSGDSGTDSGDAAKSSARMRQFTISFRVPRHPRRSRRVQFEVQDVTGTNLVYDETHAAGDEISEPLQAFGNKIIFRIFIDGKLAKQQTL